MEYCSKCNGETIFKKGISKKTGKPYQGFKCIEEDCGNMDFIHEEPGVTKEVREVKPSVRNNDDKAKTMVMAYAKDLVVALINGGVAPPNPTDEVINIYKKLMTEIEK